MFLKGLKALPFLRPSATSLLLHSRPAMTAHQQTLMGFFGGGAKRLSSKREKSSSESATPPPKKSKKFSSKSSPKKVKEPVEVIDVDEDIEAHKALNERKEAADLMKIDGGIHKAKKSASSNTKIVANKPIPYSALCDVFQRLEEEPGRLKNLAIASEFFCDVLEKSTGKDASKETAEQNLTEVTYLMINRLGPDYEPDLELGLGETLLLKALAQSTGRDLRRIRHDYHKQGDIGSVAKLSRSKQPIMFKPKALNVHQVFLELTEIAKSTGSSSQSKKIGIINRMLAACEGEEAKFLMRSLEGKLRINFGEKSVLAALAKAFVEFEGEDDVDDVEDLVVAQTQIKQAFAQTPNYELIIRNCLKHGVKHVAEYCILKPGIPVKPMLARPTKSVAEVMDTLEDRKFTCEYKYDGERAQVHLMPNGKMRVYSRNSENMTERYPDLIPVIDELRAQNPEIESLILDSECVAWDVQEHRILPFQVLSTRKRKDVQEKDIKVRVCLFVFDMLLYNGVPIIEKSLSERREYLYEHVKAIPEKLQFATKLDSTKAEEMSAFLDQSVHDSCEGLMIKALENNDSCYEPSKRSKYWLKLKKDYLEGVGDSLDLVVIGGYIGKGKRTGWYGGFLLASYNQDTGEYESVCKIGTGFSEQLLASLTEELKPKEIDGPRPSYVYSRDNSSAEPDVWFEPSMVFEVKVADLTTSPVYKSGASYFGDGEKGISLRFPRFIQVRTDKATEDATSSEQIVQMYESQAVVQ